MSCKPFTNAIHSTVNNVKFFAAPAADELNNVPNIKTKN